MVIKRGQKIIITENQTETKIRQMVDQAFLNDFYKDADSDQLRHLITWTQSDIYRKDDLTDDEISVILDVVIELITRSIEQRSEA